MPNTAPSNVFLITGTDEAQIGVEATKLVHQFAGENPDPFALDVVREQDGVAAAETINQVIRSARSPSFLGGRKTVWLRDFHGFSEEGSKTSRTPEAVALRALAAAIQAGLSEDIVLILSGPGVDGRKALSQACKEMGAVVGCSKPALRDRNWERDMRGLVKARGQEKGLRLPNDVLEHIVGAIGTDTARIEGELEKIICYCGGPDQPVTLDAARQVCVGTGEEAHWALGSAIGERDLAGSLRTAGVLLSQSKEPDGTAHGMVLQVAKTFRQLLQLRVLMQDRGLKSGRQVRTAWDGMESEEKRQLGEDGLNVADMHPYRAGLMADQALRFSADELVDAIGHLRDANLRCVSSPLSNRVILEELLCRLVPPAPKRQGSRRSPIR